MTERPPQLVSIHRHPKPDFRAAQDRLTKPPRPTPEKPLIISASELRDWLRCRVRHHWRHNMRLQPVTGAVPLAFGSVGHEILEGWYKIPFKKRTTKAMKKVVNTRLSDTLPSELAIEDVELIKAMCIGYADWVKDEDEEIGLQDCEPEMWFDLPLTEDGSIRVRGKIDNVFPSHTKKKTLGCKEFKFKGQIKVDMVDMMLQLSVYLWALRQKYPQYKRYIAYYTVLRKQMPGPRVKADLFVQESVERTDEEIAQWVEDTRRAVLDMLDASIYPNPMDACSWDCDFKIPCLLRGTDDLQPVLRDQYRSKDAPPQKGGKKA